MTAVYGLLSAGDSYIDITGIDLLIATGGAVECEVFCNDLTAARDICGNAGNDFRAHMLATTGRFRLTIEGTSITYTSNRSINTWYKLRIEWNGTEARILVDDVEVVTWTAHNAPTSDTNGPNIYRRRNVASQTNWFRGIIRNFKVFDAEGVLTNEWPLDDNVANGGTIVATTGAVDGSLVLGGSSAWVVVEQEGTISASLGSLSAAAAGEVAVQGDVTGSLGSLAASVSGQVEVQGNMTAELGLLSASAEGQVIVTGSMTADLGSLSADAQGQIIVTGNAIGELGSLSADLAGQVLVSGAIVGDLGSLDADVSGNLELFEAEGDILAALGAVSCEASGQVIVTGSIQASLGTVAAVFRLDSPRVAQMRREQDFNLRNRPRNSF